MDTVPPDEPPKLLFDYPDADLVLRSSDSQEFRVLKVYIIGCSTVLGKLIRTAPDTVASGAAYSASAETRLPEVQLPNNSAILSCLLTFIFPVPSVLPSSFEEKMELLSVAQKYEMDIVINHIRGTLALQNPQFIHKDNAFLAYSLAQRYGLRREALQAARLTLQSTLKIEKFQDVPGACLHEIWKYHQRVQAQLTSDTPLSSAGAVLEAFKCFQYAHTGPPGWVNSFIGSIIQNLSLFDPTELQLVLMEHVMVSVSTCGDKLAGCAFCAQIPAETLRTFWTTMTDIFDCAIDKVSIVSVNYILNVVERFCRLNRSCRSM